MQARRRESLSPSSRLEWPQLTFTLPADSQPLGSRFESWAEHRHKQDPWSVGDQEHGADPRPGAFSWRRRTGFSHCPRCAPSCEYFPGRPRHAHGKRAKCHFSHTVSRCLWFRLVAVCFVWALAGQSFVSFWSVYSATMGGKCVGLPSRGIRRQRSAQFSEIGKARAPLPKQEPAWICD